jgi:hypothetical protein
VGNGPNQAIMGRVVFEFGQFVAPELAWFKLPYHYGAWRYNGQRWEKADKGRVAVHQLAGRWRLFPHAPLAPCVERLGDFTPDEIQASYLRAMLPGSRFTTAIRFWNLTEDELRRLLWCVTLGQEGMAHKLGKGRYLGLGSTRLALLPESHLIDWRSRYEDEEQGRIPLDAEALLDTSLVAHHDAMRKLLHAQHL